MLRPLPLILLLFHTPFVLWRLCAYISEQAPAVVYVNTVTQPHWILAARLRRVPVVCHVRELESEVHPWLWRALTSPLLAANRLIANSQATADFLASTWRPLRRRTSVIYNGFTFPEPPVRPEVEAGGLRVIVAGRLSPRKGQDVAIDAFARAAGLAPMRLRIVGSVFPGYEWFESDLRRQARELGVAHLVEFAGYQSPIWPEFARADVVLVPSRVEPFGNVAVEGQASGAVVVASSVGGVPEIVTDDIDGLLVPTADPAALAAALHRLAADDALRRNLGKAGSVSARSRFTYDRYVDEMSAALTFDRAG
jgi:glycosyltransferase involved in cell wall biosynthesis